MKVDIRRGTSLSLGLALGAPPVMFLVVIVAASIVVGASGVADPEAIAAAVTRATPWLLLAAQVAMLGVLALIYRMDPTAQTRFSWRAGSGWRRAAALGAAAGVALALLYVSALSPAMVWLQRTLGDYVPAGELLPALGTSLAPFFIANVVLAPFVEEALYRGYALPRLIDRFGLPLGLTLHAIGFGLLHWSGGAWYMLLTGVIAGGVLAALALWRRDLSAAYAAHLALNLVEFGFVAWSVLAG